MATGLPQSNFECSICFELLLDPVVREWRPVQQMQLFS
jgi:hypothetical protein